MLDRLACNLGRNDEQPNFELAHSLAENKDTAGVNEIVNGLMGKNKAVANDCIKVLYEIGAICPLMIADYTSEFLTLLSSKNNRLVWGSMTVLATIADIKAKDIYKQIEKVEAAYETGSVITVDNSMTVFAKLCKADKKFEKKLFPMLTQHLKECRPKEVAQHAERIAICIDSSNMEEFIKVLESRKQNLSVAQIKRIDKLMKKVKGWQ